MIKGDWYGYSGPIMSGEGHQRSADTARNGIYQRRHHRTLQSPGIAIASSKEKKPKKTPSQMTGRLHFNSLTMSYFHTGIRTIIGAEAFHCPVRDGKEWYHIAMVVRHNFLQS